MGTTHQRGYVTPRGKQWYGYYRKVVNDPATNEAKTVRVPVILGLEVEDDEDRSPRSAATRDHKTTGAAGLPNPNHERWLRNLGWFVNNRFIPLKEAVWKEETAKTKKILIQLDLVEPLGDIPLVNFDKFSLQLHLNKLATTRSKDRVLQMRAYLRDIFAEAVDQDFLVKDPARKVKVPAQLRATDTTTLTWDQLRLALSKLSLRDRILLELDMTNALRPSELFAFRWKRFDYQASTLTVAETVYKGNIRDLGKNEEESDGHSHSARARRRSADMASGVRRARLGRLLQGQEEVASISRRKTSSSRTKSEASWTPTTFASGFCTSSLAISNLPKLTFQVIRRTIATLAQKKGTVKDVQGVHAALTNGYDDRCLHAGDSGECAIDDQLHQPGAEEVVGKDSPEDGEAIAGCGDFGRERRSSAALCR